MLRVELLSLYLLLGFLFLPQLFIYSRLPIINTLFLLMRRAFPIYVMIPVLMRDFPRVTSIHVRGFVFLSVLAIFLFASYQWKGIIKNPDDFALHQFGLFWSYHAIASWSLLFILQLIVYLKRSDHLPYSLLLSFYGCFIAGVLYEVPNAMHRNYLFFVYQYSMIASYVAFVYLLFRVGWKPNTLLILSLIPLCLQFPLFEMIPYWLMRLTPFPLFISIAFGVSQ